MPRALIMQRVIAESGYRVSARLTLDVANASEFITVAGSKRTEKDTRGSFMILV